MRTTINIATPILEELKKIQREEGGALGDIVSNILARALKTRQSQASGATLEWSSKPMGARVDIVDKEALYPLLDEDSS